MRPLTPGGGTEPDQGSGQTRLKTGGDLEGVNLTNFLQMFYTDLTKKI